jgi:hypothetical protein
MPIFYSFMMIARNDGVNSGETVFLAFHADSIPFYGIGDAIVHT